MTADYLTAKTAGSCTYPGCSQPCTDTTLLCQRHASSARFRVRLTNQRQRAERRAAGQCADCGRPCDRYRCLGGCGPRQLQLVPHAG